MAGDAEDFGGNHDNRRSLVDTSRLRRRSDVGCSEEEEVPNWLHEALKVKYKPITLLSRVYQVLHPRVGKILHSVFKTQVYLP